MVDEIFFEVQGVAQTAGSKRAFALTRRDGSIIRRPGRDGRPGAPIINVTDDNRRSRGWKETVAWSARRALGQMPLLAGPLEVEFTFFRVRPKSHFLKDGSLSKEGHDTPYPATKPDALKLARAAEDALTGIIWNDDAQIVTEVLRKRWDGCARMTVKVWWGDAI